MRPTTPMPDLDPLTDEQRAKIVKLVEANKNLGTKQALRQAGIAGTGGQLNRLVDTDPELAEQIQLARGWDINKVEATTWDVATNPEHPSWDRANARLLKAYRRQFRDHQHLELTGAEGGPVEVSDVSAAVDRFNDNVRRLAERAAAESGGDVRPAGPGDADESA